MRNRITLFIRRAFVKNCTDCVSREPVEPVISLRAVFINLSFRRDKQKTPFGAFIVTRRVGDPQTYALLHCSVFKEHTPAPDPLRVGSLTAPIRRGARVTTTRITPCCHPVNASMSDFCGPGCGCFVRRLLLVCRPNKRRRHSVRS